MDPDFYDYMSNMETKNQKLNKRSGCSHTQNNTRAERTGL